MFTGNFEGGSALPQFLKRRNSSEFRHQIDAKPADIGPSATEVNCMPTKQMLRQESRHGDWLGAQISQPRTQTLELLGFDQNQKVQVSAKLCRAVKHARLA